MQCLPFAGEHGVLVAVDPAELGVPGVLDPVLFTPHACFLEHPHLRRVVGVAARKHEVAERSRQEAACEIASDASAWEVWMDDVSVAGEKGYYLVERTESHR